MYLSTLLIDVGTDPDRPRPGRLWLRNLYRVHQRLCMAFPSPERKANDPNFLKPFKPEDFPEVRAEADKKAEQVGIDRLKHVHAPRTADSGFLFRVDPQPGGSVVILVHSSIEPDWEYAFHNARHLLACKPDVRSYDPSFEKGQRLCFRLMANPTRRLSCRSLGADGKPVQKGIGKRVPVPSDRLFHWLASRANAAGFSIDERTTMIQPGYVYINKDGKGRGAHLRAARYEGILTVEDPVCFKATLVAGIGPAKAFGFGLLSVAPVASAS